MADYGDQLLLETRNNIYYKTKYIRVMPCPNRFKLEKIEDWADPQRFHYKANLKFPECPSSLSGTVDMQVTEEGIWTNICCPICGYSENWSIGDGDELF